MPQEALTWSVFEKRWREPIDKALDQALRFHPDLATHLHESMRYSVLLPGKRLRPLLCLAATEACGGKSHSAMPAACAVELIHAFSLIHDDLPCMDDDDLRRGQPTNHTVYGEATALLAGDALLAYAFEVLARELFADTAAFCIRELAHATGPQGMTEGQELDMDGTAASVEQLDALYERKTGALITCALRMGARIAGASGEQLDALTLFGSKLGLAFQITDDVIDATGTEEAAGKRVGKDSAKGKCTYPQLLGVDVSQARAEQLVQEAVQALELFQSGADPLRAAALQVAERNH